MSIQCRIKKIRGAFTLLELMTVIVIIFVLVGIIIGTQGYVQRRGAFSRAQAEIQAMSAALESYRADNGIYPQFDSMGPDGTFHPKNYTLSSLTLYAALTGQGIDDDDDPPTAVWPPPQKAKRYMDFRPQMLAGVTSKQKSGDVEFIEDPFGYSYGYSTKGDHNPTFDLWSTGGKVKNRPEDRANWVTNW